MGAVFNSRMLLRNARLALPQQLIETAAVRIENGRISSIYFDQSSVEDRRDAELDLSGLTLFPGFIDVHIHGAVGVDIMDADAAGLRRVSKYLATRGVTAWLPTLVPAPDADYKRAIAAIEKAMTSSAGARILGVHYEGPFVNSTQCGALRAQYFRGFLQHDALDSLPTLSNPAAVHMLTIAP
jgi:N-acetylglucosamine-6-phosphate deacetylase